MLGFHIVADKDADRGPSPPPHPPRVSCRRRRELGLIAIACSGISWAGTLPKTPAELDLDLLDAEEASKFGRPRDNPNPRPSETKACMQGDAP
jgi:hypothetical protein